MFAGLLCSLAATTTLQLYRGSAQPGTDLAYWDVRETSLSRNAPDESNAGGYVLEGGPSNTILIRYGSLNRFRGRIKGARIRLHITDGKSQLGEVAVVKTPWSEGALPLPTFLQKQLAGGEASVGATWKLAKAGVRWGSDGVRGNQDAEPIAGAQATQVGDDTVVIEGLTQAVKQMAARPSLNFGFALRFQSPISFGGSRALSGRPTLELDLADEEPPSGIAVGPVSFEQSGPTLRAKAQVWNRGTQTIGRYQASWTVAGRGGSTIEVANALKPGESAMVETNVGIAAKGTEVSLWAGANGTSDEATGYVGGQELKLKSVPAGSEKAVAEYLNVSLFPRSQYSFARDGVRLRVNVLASGPPQTSICTKDMVRAALVELGLKDLRKGTPENFGTGILGGESRTDALLAGLPLIPEPLYQPLLETSPPETTGLLGMSHVAQLNGVGVRDARVLAILRPVNLTGERLADVRIDILEVGAPDGQMLVKDQPLDKEALSVSFPDGATLADRSFRVVGRLNGAQQETVLYGFQLTDLRLRSQRLIPVVDVPLNLPLAALSGVDFATGKAVASDSGPIDLSKPKELPGQPGSYIEIDLGRDRTIGELVWVGTPWKSFRVVTYETGGSPTEALPWIEEVDGLWRATKQGSGAVRYRLPVRKIRYVRVISKMAQAPAVLSKISLTGVQATESQ